jgi:hypothetical protein
LQRSIKIKLTRKRWEYVRTLLEEVTKAAPVESFETDSIVLAEYYYKNFTKLSFFVPNKQGEMNFTLKLSEAYALYYIHMNDEFRTDMPLATYFISNLQNQLRITA